MEAAIAKRSGKLSGYPSSGALHHSYQLLWVALSWDGSAALWKALPDAAGKLRIPILCMVSENHATAAAVQSAYDAARAHRAPAELVIYPPFAPSEPYDAAYAARDPCRSGALHFRPAGMPIWGKDVLAFLGKYLRG